MGEHRLDLYERASGLVVASASLVVGESGVPTFPDATTTGVRDPSLLVAHPNAGLNIQTHGVVIENRIFSRYVNIQANDVTIRNCLWRSNTDFYPFRVYDGYTNCLIEDVEIDGMSSESINAGIAGRNWTARRVNIHSMQDGCKIGSGCTLEDSYIHDLHTTKASPHYDCVQATGTGIGIVIRGNNLQCGRGPGYTSAILLKSDLGPIDDVLVEGNLLNGGGFTFYSRIGKAEYGEPLNDRLLNNRFGRDYQYGLFSIDGTVEKSGNVWHDTGEPV